MKRSGVSFLALLLALLFAPPLFAQGAGTPSSADVVKARGYLSKDAVRPGDRFKIAVAIEIAKDYHINAHVVTFDFLIPTAIAFEPFEGLTFGESKYPEPEHSRFEFFPDADLAVHSGIVYVTTEVEAGKTLTPGAGTIRGKLRVQSCSKEVCLSPSNIDVEIPVRVVAAGTQTNDANVDVFTKAAAASLAVFEGAGRDDDLGRIIASQGIGWTLLTVFLAGLALNLTPCVYPIIPITVGFFVNQGASRLQRTFMMASMYVLGMAVTYSLLGVAASMTKGLFGAALQSPIVLVALAAVMVALSLSMFGLYEFKLPEFLNRFATKSAESTSGMVGALVMGLTMGIVAAPCIGPFVLGLLVHVGAKGDPLYGFMLFFVLALGLGLPYLFLGTFSGAIKALPRSGMWMVTVRKVFGLVLVGMALYFLMPLMGEQAKYVMMAFFSVAALYLIFWESSRTKPAAFAWLLRALGVGAAVVVVWLSQPPRPGIEWQPYSEAALDQARLEGRGVAIDAFADWCLPCKELDHLTFTDPEVRQEAERFVRLKLDLTQDDPQSEAGRAKEKFRIRGVPTILLLDAAGNEVPDLRLEGFEQPDLFLNRLKKIEFTVSNVQ